MILITRDFPLSFLNTFWRSAGLRSDPCVEHRVTAVTYVHSAYVTRRSWCPSPARGSASPVSPPPTCWESLPPSHIIVLEDGLVGRVRVQIAFIVSRGETARKLMRAEQACPVAELTQHRGGFGPRGQQRRLRHPRRAKTAPSTTRAIRAPMLRASEWVFSQRLFRAPNLKRT